MSSVNHTPILILMGPTASGKSALGVSIAQRVGGVIINADTMQCYKDLHVLTARPRQPEMQGVPHALYGVWDARMMGNAKRWLEAATTQIHQVVAAGNVPILVGGTGMYLKALTEGLSPVPPISEDTQRRVAQTENLFDALQQYDPVMAARLKPNDSQRISRALEVFLETGKSLAEWQDAPVSAPFAKDRCHFAYVNIPREQVYANINQRFEAMIEGGALDEVAALKARFSPEEIAEQRFPILKAHGAPELMAHLDGTMTLQEAMAKGQQNTRNYAKRQLTWLRGQVKDAHALAWDGGEQAAEGWLKSLPFTATSA